MSILSKPLLWKIRHLVCMQIQDSDGLLYSRLRSAKSIVEQRGVTSVRTQRNCFRETVRALRRAGGWFDYRFTSWESGALLRSARNGLDEKSGAEKHKDNFYSGGQSASSEP
jgi:hypothetical protein